MPRRIEFILRASQGSASLPGRQPIAASLGQFISWTNIAQKK